MLDFNEIEYCKLQVKYEADSKDILSKRNEIINKLKNQKIPGFRPGHITSDVVKKHFKQEINEQLKQELAETAVSSFIQETNIKPFGRPNFSSISLEEPYIIVAGGSDIPKFRCEFSMFKQPDFELNQYKDFELPKAYGIPSIEEIYQKTLQELRTKYGESIPYGENDFVQSGDTIILDYKTTMDETVVDNLTGTGQMLNVGRINIPGFSESLYGMKPGDTREFDLNMPESKDIYSNKNLHFEVCLQMGSKVQLATLDDAFAIKLELKNFNELEENLKSLAATRAKELEKAHNMDQIIKRIIENHEFKIPTWISLAEAQINARNAKVEWEKISDADKEQYTSSADKSIKLSLVLQRIRENEPDAQLTNEEVITIARQNLSKFSPEPDKIMEELYKNGHIALFFNRVRDEYTLEFIEKNSKFME